MHRRRAALLLAPAIAASAATAVWAVSSRRGHDAPPTGARVLGTQITNAGGNGDGSTATGDAFGVSGRVDDLVPGRAAPFTLTLTNPNSFAIDVQTVTVAVGTPRLAAGRTGCTSADLSIPPFTGHVAVPGKGGTATVTATATLRGGDGCQGAVFPFAFGGSAVKP